ncbi:MAG: LCP family protein [Clostridia bacterium]|jgi:LCP family protein required for cell wall assembly|nr:LCP family protein [Clostridia bacterium]
MKKLISLLLACCLLIPAASMAGEDDDLLIEEITEEAAPEAEQESGSGEPAADDVFVDEDTGETYILTEEEQQKLDELIEEDVEEDDTGIDPDSLDKNPNLPENVINILLIGVDTRSKDPQEILGRGDTQIIVSINRDTGAIKMTSILRDSLVPIPGYKNQTKINNSFAYGNNRVKKGTTQEKVRSGAALAMRTINRNFQMNIENYVAINFNGLASIIDALGGIDIELTKGEAWYINKYLKEHPPAYDNKAKGERTPLEVKAGVQHLDGVQAVMYARTRSLAGENDFNRTDRQRHLLDLLLQQVTSNLDFSTLMDLIDVAVSYADTNMNFQTLWDLATSLAPALTQMTSGESLFEQMRVPMDHSYSYTTHNGSSVIKYNLKKHAQAIHEFVYGTYYPAD